VNAKTGKQTAPARHDSAESAFRAGVEALRRGQLDAAEQSFAQAAKMAADQPSPRLGLALVLDARGRAAAATAAVRAVLDDFPGFAAAQRILADRVRETDPAEAGQWYVRCARHAPADSVAIGSALLLAARLQRAGVAAPPTPVPLAAPPALTSVVICSIRPQSLAMARSSLARAFGAAPWELIHIDDARSLCEGWNRGLAASNGDAVVFCHDDIAITCDRLGERLGAALADDDVVGVAGSRQLAGPNWIWAGAPHAHGCVAHVRGNELLAGAYSVEGPRVAAIESLDGVFLAMRRATALAIGFDAATYDGFHLYDADFCWRARRAGLRLAVRCDLGLVHWSEGQFNAEWTRYARRFLQRVGLPDQPMAPIPGASTAIDTLEALPGTLAWLAHWVHAA
jgi:hypothetical protein